MKIVDAAGAAALIRDGATVASAGFVGAGHAEAVTAAIEARFLALQRPRDLTLVYSAGQGDRAHRGVNHFGHEGLVRRVIGGHWRSAPKLSRLAIDEKCEAYNLPQGVITHLYRAIAARGAGVFTRIGLNTFVDPLHGGGRLNARAVAPLVERIELGGEPWLRYLPFPVDVALVRGTTADAHGNISCEHEPFHHELLAIAQAARNSGGIVIAQVKRLAERHADPQQVRLPGILVDYVVVAGDDPATHGMTFGEHFNPAYTGELRTPGAWAGPAGAAASAPPGSSALDARAIVQRRAALELAVQAARNAPTGRRLIVNLGVGMPAAVAGIARQAGVQGFVPTVEAGPIGGTPADGLSFGASSDPEAVVDEPAQFDFYDGGGIDLAFLGLAEVDVAGNVNVSMFGHGAQRSIAGVGGFINITQSARSLVFMGTMTAGGLAIEVRDGRLNIVSEGRSAKVVGRVAHLSFNGPYVASLGREILYLTERAVFRLLDGRLTLVEVAPGVDVRRDVLDRCSAPVAVSKALATMDARVFRDGPLRLD